MTPADRARRHPLAHSGYPHLGIIFTGETYITVPVRVSAAILDAAEEGAALGRAYGEALRRTA